MKIGVGELSGSDPRAGPFWPEPVLRTRAFRLRTDWSDRQTGKMKSDLRLLLPVCQLQYLALFGMHVSLGAEVKTKPCLLYRSDMTLNLGSIG